MLSISADAVGLIDLAGVYIASYARQSRELGVTIDPGSDAVADGLEVSLQGGADALVALEAKWRAVDAPDSAVFQSHAWTSAAAGYHKEKGARIEIALVERDGRIEAALPVAITRRGGVRVGLFLGDPTAQYGDVWAARGASSRAVRLAVAALAESRRIDVFEFRRVRSDAAIAPALSAARTVGAPIDAPFARLGARSVDEMLRAIGGAKQARERGRVRRRLEEVGEVRLEVLRGADALPAVREAISIKRAWLVERGLASVVLDDHAAMRAIDDVVRRRDEGCEAVAMRLTVRGEPAAYEIGFLRGRTHHAYLGAVAPGFAQLGPGKTQMEETLRWLASGGYDTYDLLPSTDEYKRHWATDSVTVRDYALPVTALGRLYATVWLEHGRPRARALVDRLPPRFRRRAMMAAS